MAEARVKEWQDRAQAFTSKDRKALETPFAELDAHLTLRSFIVGFTQTEADLVVWTAIRENHIAYGILKQGTYINLTRWFKYIEETNPSYAVAQRGGPKDAKAGNKKEKADEDPYDIGLQDTEKGVVTRFPPEPSGYLHIGHAKAALLNDYFAHEKYKGTLLLRFDDTNPTKEKQEYQDAIVEDLALMGIKPDKTSYTSDFFQELYETCVQMLKDGKAYADDTPSEKMRAERWDGIASERRDASPEDNLAHFEEMKNGTEEGLKWCIRAKISVDDPNKALRDPVIYRCNLESHHRTGSTWKIYPTYDFCCPIVDSMEGVTHALRTTEYKDRDAQYQWFIKNLNLRGVYNWDFARMNFVRTLLSKRKLTKFVDTCHVWGWDDPRMPTIRGIRRRGMTIPALREFILKQGPSKNVVNLSWDSFWAMNKYQIDPIAKRYTAINTHEKVAVTIENVNDTKTVNAPVHAKNKDLGTKQVVTGRQLIIEQADAASFEQDEEITLMNWGNAIVRHVSRDDGQDNAGKITAVKLELHLEGDVKKTKKKITWLSVDQELVPVELVDFDFLITKDKLGEEDNYEDFLTKETEFRTAAFADCNVAGLRVHDIIQFDRKGFFRVDEPFVKGEGDAPSKPAVLFQIPTGKSK